MRLGNQFYACLLQVKSVGTEFKAGSITAGQIHAPSTPPCGQRW